MPRSTTTRLPLLLVVCAGLAGLYLWTRKGEAPSERTATTSAPQSRGAVQPEGNRAGTPGREPMPETSEREAANAAAQREPGSTEPEHLLGTFGGGAEKDATGGGPHPRTAAIHERARRQAGLKAGRAAENAVDEAGRPLPPGAVPSAPPPDPPPPAFASADGVEYALGARVELPALTEVPHEAGTLSFWLQPQWGAGNQDGAGLAELGILQVVKEADLLRFGVAGDGNGVTVPVGDWQTGQWHEVALAWNGRFLNVYVDGQLAGTGLAGMPINLLSNSQLWIGSNAGDAVAPGTITRIDVQPRPLTPAELAADFAAGRGR